MIIQKLKYLFLKEFDDWEIGIIKNNDFDFFDFQSNNIKWFSCKNLYFEADPFAIERNGLIYLFYEEFSRKKNYGIICCSVLNNHLKIIEKRIILDDGMHKSFPFIFIVEGELYMMPESVSMNNLNVYKCIDFPFQWRLHKTILNSPCSDAIIFSKDYEWYLLYTLGNSENENKNLYLRKNNNPFNDWELSDEKLIKTDLQSARNAGNLISIENKLIRVSQDCSVRYGNKVVLNEILEINSIRYNEIKFSEIHFNRKGIYGPHTLNRTENFTFLDRQRKRQTLKNPSEVYQGIKLFIKKILSKS